MKKFKFNPRVEYQIIVSVNGVTITETYSYYLKSFSDVLKLINNDLDYFYNNKILTFEILNLKTYEILYKRKVIRL